MWIDNGYKLKDMQSGRSTDRIHSKQSDLGKIFS